MLDIQPVILCGGSGTRLWPLSRTGFPKQYLCLTGEQSLFQLAAKRMHELDGGGLNVFAPYVVANDEHRFLAQEQLREAGVPVGAMLLEPIGRNTAPALTLAALAALEASSDPILVVTPADQSIKDSAAFMSALQDAIRAASTGEIAILGITPDRPETGYGYVKTEKVLNEVEASILPVTRFVEKPNAGDAAEYLREGGYYWNAGVFVLKASVWIKALEEFRLDILDAIKEAWAARSVDGHFVRPEITNFSASASESIDCAVMERCIENDFSIGLVPLDAGWNDLGAWDSVWNELQRDETGNASIGDTFLSNTKNSLVYASSRIVCLLGTENIVVVETPDAVLVADKGCAQNVKAIVGALVKENREEHATHRKVHRPWGWYDSVDEGERFKVKRILVKPGASLSLQRHQNRAEHWVVVKGVAEITKGDELFRLSENQSTYIQPNEIHRLANPGLMPLEIIEVQSGSYLGEDDILRIDDQYGRS